MATAQTVKYPTPAAGYSRGDGEFAEAAPVVMLGLQALAEGVTEGPVFEVGDKAIARLAVECHAKSGTSPTLDLTLMTSPDGRNGWWSAGTFTQRTGAAAPLVAGTPGGLVMGAVTSGGTTPPTITLTSSAQVQPVNLRIECTTLGARGTAVIRYSVDGGKTWVSNVLTAATISVVDPNGIDTGVVINYANATAAVDNYWTATTIGYERKSFSGLDRFAKVVALVGGTDTPIVTALVSGELL